MALLLVADITWERKEGQDGKAGLSGAFFKHGPGIPYGPWNSGFLLSARGNHDRALQLIGFCTVFFMNYGSRL